MSKRTAPVCLVLALFLVACIGTTGSDLIGFAAYGAGAEGASTAFTNGQGWTVTLTRARLHVGAVYLNRSVPVSGGQERACFLPGIYVAQVLGGIDLDLLSPTLQRFPVDGDGTEDRAVTGEVWLTGGRVDALDDATQIADVAGVAVRAGVTRRFEATITIGRNRAIPPTDPAKPGANPLCAQRIVTPIPVDVTPKKTGALVLRVDPRHWFANVDFASVETVSKDSNLVRIPDDGDTQAGTNLFGGIRAATGVYDFRWQELR